MELEQIQIRATLGFSDAQLALGYMYYDGIGVPLDRERAMRLFKRAAGQGDAQAAWTLARAEQAAPRAPKELQSRVPTASTEPRSRLPTAPKAPKAQKEPRSRLPSAPRAQKAHAVPMEWAPTAPSLRSAEPSTTPSLRSSACAVSAAQSAPKAATRPRRRLLPTERHAIALLFEHRCAACRALLPVGWNIDHRIPLADGGPDDASNMQPLCPHCHTLKTAHENSRRRSATVGTIGAVSQ
jgi:5-methylcytosine-specific restriction protein A